MTSLRSSGMIAGAFMLSFLFASCSDDNDNDIMFPDPVGFSLQIDAIDLVTYENGNYEYNPEGLTPEFEYNDMVMLSMSYKGGNIYKGDNPEDPKYYTADIGIRFYDARGNVIDYPQERLSDDYDDINPDGEYRLEWEWLDDVAVRHANIENHSDMGSWLFHFRADQPGETGIIFKVYRCEGERQIIQKGDRTDPDNPETTLRECSVAEEKVFEASAPMRIHVDEYEGLRDDGRYPHERHFRIR